MSIISIGTSNPIELDTATLPQASIEALLRRGASHVFGNEVASKVVSWRNSHKNTYMAEQRKAAGPEAKLTDEQASQGYVAPAEDEEDAKREEFKQGFLKALADGTLGVRSSVSIAVDPLDVEMEKIAKEQVKAAIAKQAGPDGKAIKMPKKGESVTCANGATRTLEQMIARRLELDGANIKAQAQKVLKEKAARAKAAQKAVETVGDDDLGL